MPENCWYEPSFLRGVKIKISDPGRMKKDDEMVGWWVGNDGIEMLECA